MNWLDVEHTQRMEKLVAWLRLAVVLLAGTVMLDPGRGLLAGVQWGAGIWIVAVVYAVGAAFGQPYRLVPLGTWAVVSGLIDWGLIGLAIIATGGARSELYVLYFILLLSIGLRFSLATAAGAYLGTAVGYLGIVYLTASPVAPALPDSGLRVGCVLLLSVGASVMAREIRRHFQARVEEEAQRLAVQEVTARVRRDLLQPIATVTGLVEAMLQSAAEDLSLDQRALLHRINAGTQQMSNLASNLIDAELIERGQQSFQPAPVDLNALVRRVVEAQSHQAEVKQIGLVLDLSPRLQRALLDARMIERLVANLLSNAVNFCPESGAVRVSTRQHESRLTIEVWNSGSRLPASLQPVLFEKFARQHGTPGIGLGLYICKSVVDMHRGTISARNAAEGGVVFAAELPAAGAKVTAPGAARREAARPASPALQLSVASQPEAG